MRRAITSQLDLLPDPALHTVPRLIEAAAAAFAERPAVIDGAVRLTYSDLRREARRIACALSAAGVQPGERVGIWAPNGWEWVAWACGIWCAGGVVVTLSTREKAPQLADMLGRTRARAVIARSEFLGMRFLDMLQGASGGARDGRPCGLPELASLVLLDGTSQGSGVWSAQDFLERGETVPDDSLAARIHAAKPRDLMGVLFTSGTTGRPKGVMLRHAMLRAYQRWNAAVGLGPDDRMLVIHPYANASGFNGSLILSFVAGSAQLPVPVFDPGGCLDLIERERITILLGPPNFYTRMLDHPSFARRDLSAVRVACAGSTAVPVAFVQRLRRALPGACVVNAYGMSEMGGVTMTRLDDPIEVVAHSSGRLLPDVELRIVEDGRDVAVGEQGEVWVRADTMTAGYWEDDRITAEAIDPAGWYHTGDVGMLDAAGNLSIVGRKKELYIVGGFNVYPAEIENLLLGRPDISQAAVIALPHAELGEVGCAFVVSRDAATIDTRELQAWVKARVANYKVPQRVLVLDALPVTLNGKVDKRRLLRLALEGTDADGLSAVS
jgi:acyl-CoA synthetase (AMP-forming)/AMP-acid ligase II